MLKRRRLNRSKAIFFEYFFDCIIHVISSVYLKRKKITRSFWNTWFLGHLIKYFTQKYKKTTSNLKWFIICSINPLYSSASFNQLRKEKCKFQFLTKRYCLFY